VCQAGAATQTDRGAIGDGAPRLAVCGAFGVLRRGIPTDCR
jgi:hypothetical protein